MNLLHFYCWWILCHKQEHKTVGKTNHKQGWDLCYSLHPPSLFHTSCFKETSWCPVCNRPSCLALHSAMQRWERDWRWRQWRFLGWWGSKSSLRQPGVTCDAAQPCRRLVCRISSCAALSYRPAVRHQWHFLRFSHFCHFSSLCKCKKQAENLLCSFSPK